MDSFDINSLNGEEKKTLRILFWFLKKECVLDKFINEIQLHGPAEFVNLLKTPLYIIYVSFSWIVTDDGWEYWEEIDKKWTSFYCNMLGGEYD